MSRLENVTFKLVANQKYDILKKIIKQVAQITNPRHNESLSTMTIMVHICSPKMVGGSLAFAARVTYFGHR